jgi:uncharacterized protein
MSNFLPSKANFSKYTLLTLGFFLLVLNENRGQSTIAQEPSKGLLWKISGKGIKESYLFGTMHLISADKFFMPREIEKCIRNSDVVAFEIDMDKMKGLGALSLIPKMFMDNSEKLYNLLEEDQYNKVRDYFKSKGIPAMMVDRLKPMLLNTMADETFSDKSQMKSMVSYEKEIDELAKQYDLKTIGLETANYQISIFDSIPYEEQAKSLYESISQVKDEKNEMKDLEDLYAQGDIEALNKYMAESLGKDERMQRLFLDNRNINWVAKIPKLSKSKNTFYAVGAGHLPGKNGVINLLRNEGYQVKSIPIDYSK